MFLLEFSSLTKRILFFILLSCFKQCVLGLSGLLGLNARKATGFTKMPLVTIPGHVISLMLLLSFLCSKLALHYCFFLYIFLLWLFLWLFNFFTKVFFMVLFQGHHSPLSAAFSGCFFLAFSAQFFLVVGF